MTAVDVLVDTLEGVVPTWRIDAEDDPIYRDVVALLGVPGSLLGPAPSAVVAGHLVDPDDDVDDEELDVEEEHPRAVEAPPTVPIPLRPTTALPAPARAPRKRRPSARRAAS